MQGGWTTAPLALRLVLLPEGEPPPRPDGSPGEKRAAMGDGGGFGGFCQTLQGFDDWSCTCTVDEIMMTLC